MNEIRERSFKIHGKTFRKTRLRGNVNHDLPVLAGEDLRVGDLVTIDEIKSVNGLIVVMKQNASERVDFVINDDNLLRDQVIKAGSMASGCYADYIEFVAPADVKAGDDAFGKAGVISVNGKKFGSYTYSALTGEPVEVLISTK